MSSFIYNIVHWCVDSNMKSFSKHYYSRSKQFFFLKIRDNNLTFSSTILILQSYCTLWWYYNAGTRPTQPHLYHLVELYSTYTTLLH